MTDRPIIFSAPMVKALLDGRKSMTRRLAWRYRDCLGPDDEEGLERLPSPWQKTAVGDRLYVRETWRSLNRFNSDRPGKILSHSMVAYEADDSQGDYRPAPPGRMGKIRTAIHMPRWASRLTLIVVGVHVERLQDISYNDCRDEGVVCPIHGTVSHTSCTGLRKGFEDLWASLHGPDAWRENPEVVVLTFGVNKRNIDI